MTTPETNSRTPTPFRRGLRFIVGCVAVLFILLGLLAGGIEGAITAGFLPTILFALLFVDRAV
ncbi:MAG: hypothetical protein ACF8PN_06755 [Phycisphaerales bacterium]